jgi:5-methylcytosine-specific restriction endonuclease McrBC regulatory subunit McrC
MREYSADNPVMQLIRHTIEFIKSDPRRTAILRSSTEIKEAVAQIAAVTPTYNAQERGKVIFQNLRGVNHPYFTEYTVLRDLCLRILRHDKVSTGNDDKHIRGIVFDGAWLWEEYLATLLKDMGFEHPENRTGKGARYPFKDDNKTGPMFPDFIGKNTVLDAKYKELDEKENISREDRFQMIAYMYVLQKTQGYVLYPTPEEINTDPISKELNGYGGSLGKIGFYIPSSSDIKDFLSFSEKMKSSEENFVKNVSRCTETALFSK